MAPRKLTTQDEVRVALRRVRLWESDKSKPVQCPLCGAPELKIIDRSTRPYSEWYAVECASCGLDDTIHIPSAARNV
jgi:transcription elongation factor Elf1